jgi:GAF domain-containing protein
MTDARTASNPEPLLKLSVRALLNIVVLEHGRPVAIFFAHFDRPASWSPEVLAFLRNVAERVQIGIARLKAEEQQRILNHELSHRMKNTLMMVQAIAGQTPRTSPTVTLSKRFRIGFTHSPRRTKCS